MQKKKKANEELSVKSVFFLIRVQNFDSLQLKKGDNKGRNEERKGEKKKNVSVGDYPFSFQKKKKEK